VSPGSGWALLCVPAGLTRDYLGFALPGRPAHGEAMRFGVVAWLVLAYTESYMTVMIQNVGRLS
jgi:hypothetical protein